MGTVSYHSSNIKNPGLGAGEILHVECPIRHPHLPRNYTPGMVRSRALLDGGTGDRDVAPPFSSHQHRGSARRTWRARPFPNPPPGILAHRGGMGAEKDQPPEESDRQRLPGPSG